MSDMISNMVMLLVLIALIVGNQIADRKSKQRRKAICWLLNRNTMLGLKTSHNIIEDIYVPVDALRMSNRGTSLAEETDRLIFKPIATQEDYYGKV